MFRNRANLKEEERKLHRVMTIGQLTNTVTRMVLPHLIRPSNVSLSVSDRVVIVEPSSGLLGLIEKD
jgi:hypothetical protein